MDPNVIPHSPLPFQQTVAVQQAIVSQKMGFPAAAQAIIDGKKVTKESWGNPNIFCQLQKDGNGNGFLMIFNNAWGTWTVSEGDMIGLDYVVIQ